MTETAVSSILGKPGDVETQNQITCWYWYRARHTRFNPIRYKVCFRHGRVVYKAALD